MVTPRAYQDPAEARPGLDVLLTMLVMAALAAAALYAATFNDTLALGALRYLPLIPVSLAAYRPGGRLAGQAMAGFFSSLLLWQLVWPPVNAAAPAGVELVTAALLLHLVAYAAASASATVRGRETLADAARGWRGLLARAASLDEVADFILTEAAAIIAARDAALLLRNPIAGGWELAAGGTRSPLPAGPTLAGWLAAQGKPQLIDDLDADPRFGPRPQGPATGPRSLLAQLLRADEGTTLGILVLLDRRGRPFGHRDLDRLAPLLAAGGQALAQAGLLARTDQALARRAMQLAAIQQAGRDLNAALDAGSIARRALTCAAEIIRADTLAVVAAAEGLPLVWEAGAAALDASRASAIATTAREMRYATLEPAAALALSAGRSRLAAPLRRGTDLLGVIVAESAQEGAFDGQDLLAVAALADHATIALENARLFAQVQGERERAGQIIGHMADGLLTLDGAGRVLALNPAAEQLTGWRSQEAAGRHASEVLGCGAEDAAALASTLARPRAADAPHEGRLEARSRAGACRVLGYSAAPLPDQGSVLLIRDITREQELQEFQRELVATFSHELRAPLANIEALTQTLLGDGAGDGTAASPAPTPARAHLEMLRAQSRRLAALAERTLDVARLEAGAWRLEPRPLALGRLLADAQARWAAAAGRPIRLAAPEARLWALADEEAAAVVLDNLVDNALKYSPADTEIALALAAEPAGFATVAVIDHGPGIPPGLRERAFQRFTRLEAGDAQRTYGVGLGLYVTQRLVTAMGGRIWVEDAAGGGSRFAFTLPLCQEAELEDPDC